MRIHPAIIAQAAATSAVMLEGRFNLGVGSGEALNEHILGDHWPEADVRLEMLEEAVEVMRALWRGGQHSHRGPTTRSRTRASTTCPTQPPPVLVSGFGPKAIRLAARIGDGYCTTSPDKEAIELYRSEGGKGPVHAGTKVCFMADEDEARETAHRLWPNEALPGELAQVLPTPSHFEQACELVEPEMLVPARRSRPRRRTSASLRQYVDAGVDELFVQQIGPDQDAFFDTWAPQVLPHFS